MDYAIYIRNRITELRIQKDVSEYRMSLDLGQNRNYIQGITSGKALPSMAQFLKYMRILRNNPYAVFRPGGTPFTATFQRVDFYGSIGIPRYAVNAAPV